MASDRLRLRRDRRKPFDRRTGRAKQPFVTSRTVPRDLDGVFGDFLGRATRYTRSSPRESQGIRGPDSGPRGSSFRDNQNPKASFVLGTGHASLPGRFFQRKTSFHVAGLLAALLLEPAPVIALVHTSWTLSTIKGGNFARKDWSVLFSNKTSRRALPLGGQVTCPNLPRGSGYLIQNAAAFNVQVIVWVNV